MSHPTAALEPGEKAPDFSLIATNESHLIVSEALRHSDLLVLAFFKVSCPVCQFAFPYLERLHRQYPAAPIWGVSQDDKDATAAFARTYGISFPVVLDVHLQSTVEYGLTNVPSIFLLGRDGTILHTIVGFSKADFERLNSMVAKLLKESAKELFTIADDVPALKPG